MKKLTILLALLAALTLSLTACGGDAPETPATVGQTLEEIFQADPSGSALTVAQRVVEHESIPFMPMAMEVEPGLLNGFGNTEITGFAEGASFGPAIGTIPFLGYVFTLDDAADGAAFCQTLKDAADLRWNICTEADELVVTQSGDKVFFLMCPEQFES